MAAPVPAISRFFGDASAPGHGSVTFAAPVKLASLNPHMHLRGKDFVYRLVYPTGESEIILNVPKYDYAWQPGYRFEKMLELPAGTRLEMDGHWDNSPNNPNNPDPTATVRWGQQIWEEMFGGGITLLVPARNRCRHTSEKRKSSPEAVSS